MIDRRVLILLISIFLLINGPILIEQLVFQPQPQFHSFEINSSTIIRIFQAKSLAGYIELDVIINVQNLTGTAYIQYSKYDLNIMASLHLGENNFTC